MIPKSKFRNLFSIYANSLPNGLGKNAQESRHGKGSFGANLAIFAKKFLRHKNRLMPQSLSEIYQTFREISWI